MPKIPYYQRQVAPQTGSGNALMDVGGAGVVGDAVSRMGKTGMMVVNEFADVIEKNEQRLKSQDNGFKILDAQNKIDEKYRAYSQDVLNQAKQSNLDPGGLRKFFNDKDKEFLDGLKKDHYDAHAGNADVQLHVGKYLNSTGDKLLNYTAGLQTGMRTDYALNASAKAQEIAVNNVRNGIDAETEMKGYAEKIGALHATGVYSAAEAEAMIVKGQQHIAAAYLDALSISDPRKAAEVIKSGKYNTFLEKGDFNRLQTKAKSLDDQARSVDAMAELTARHTKDGKTDFKSAVAEASSPEFMKKNNLSIDQAQNITTSLNASYAATKEQERVNKEEAIDEVNKILVPIALKRNGINRPSDLSAGQWAKLTERAPEYAAKLQDTMRRENDILVRENKKERRDAERERRLQQADNESSILISDDFATRDLKRDLAAGDISPAQYTKLLKAQNQLDPIKRDSVRAALKKVNDGNALAKALSVTDKAEAATWKLKYGDLVKAWAYNHADDPNFDAKMTEFVEKQVLSEMVTSWFSGDESDRLEKYQTAKKEAGELPQRGKKKAVQKYSQEDLEFTAKKHGITVDEVKKRLGVQ